MIKDKKRWDTLFSKLPFKDFYFTYDYHSISSVQTEYPVLIHFHENNSGILFPLLLRDIEDTPYMDATSVYGYAGPLYYGNLESLNKGSFRKELKRLFKDLEIISVFSRLHPFIESQQGLLKGLGNVQNLGRVVNIDISLPPAEQWSQISRRNRTYLNKARRSYSVRKAQNRKDLEVFIHLYHQTMRRLNADPKYFFDNEYFDGLWNSSSFETTILLAENSVQNTIGGAMFISSGDIIQYHLSGTDENHLKLHPVKLLIDEMRIQGTNQGFHYFNLGGGLGGFEDSLFQFKAKFSKDYRKFSIWKFIADEKIYRELSRAHLGNSNAKNSFLDETYFPRYRFED